MDLSLSPADAPLRGARVLITGGNGFIGRRATDKLLAQGARVRWASRSVPDVLPDGVEHVRMDVSRPDELDRALEGVSHVIHLAAREDFPLLPKGDPDGDLMFKTNVLGTHRLLSACHGRSIARVVVCTAIWSFGWDQDGTPNPGREPHNIGMFRSVYALSRYQCEFVCMEHAARGLPVIVAAPSIVVGAGDQKVAGPAVRWSSTGWIKLVPSGGANCIDVDDVAQGMVNALYRGTPGRRYLFVNENVTWQRFFTLIANELGVKPPGVMPGFFIKIWQGVLVLRSLLTGQRRAFGIGPEILVGRFYFDGQDAVRELGLPQTPIETSVAQTVTWVRTGQLPAPTPQLPGAEGGA